ncbi:MAG: TlyA family RNA methyltransferase [Pseudomonadota bacterium]
MADKRERADKLLVARSYFESRAAARAAIEAGRVTANGVTVEKPSAMIDVSAEIEAVQAHPFVSRGGVKLAHALAAFDVSVDGAVCLDIGASTGGFTDALLQAGAAHVVAVDVGRGQLHNRVRADPRVTSYEGLDARHLSAEYIHGDTRLVVVDASFISLAKLLSRPLSLVAARTQLIALFKPQFEVGRRAIGKGGLVSDAAAIPKAREAFAAWLGGEGWAVRGWTESPITGGNRNREWLVHAVKAGDAP